MTFFEFAVIGYIIGFVSSAPVGAVNIMAIRRSIHDGFWHGVFVGLGATVADTMFAAIAIFGVSAVTNFIDNQFSLIEIFGGLLLVLFGYRIWHTHAHLDKNGNGGAHGFIADGSTSFLMAITNPGTLFAIVAILGVLGQFRPEHGDHFGALTMTAGVAAGATSWWFVVSAVVTHFKARIDDRVLDRVNHIAGALLIAFGVLIFAHVVWDVIL